MKHINSPLELHTLRNRKIYIKRDDLLDEDFSGNKARKFYYFLVNDFSFIKREIEILKPKVIIVGGMKNKKRLGKIIKDASKRKILR